MRKTIIALSIIAAVLLLGSCEKEIEFNGEQTASRLVINCLAKAGEPIHADLSKSVFFLDNENDPTPPDGTTVHLFINGEDKGEMTALTGEYGYKDRRFVHPYQPEPGDVIKITASAEGFEDVEGTSSPMPEYVTCQLSQAEILNYEIEYHPDWDPIDTIYTVQYETQLLIDITDPHPGATDLFYLALTPIHNDDEISDSYYSITATYDDPIYGNVLTETDFLGEQNRVFTDLMFDGKNYQLKIPVNVYIRVNQSANPDFFQYEVRLEHITKEYYNYLKTADQNDDISGLLVEPTHTFSNVEGGYGVVCGESISRMIFPLTLSRK